MNSRFYEEEKERILTSLRKRLEELFPSEVCHFSKVCKGYRKDAYTCQHEMEAKYYCGLYKLHEAAILQGDMKRMLSSTDFADFDV